MNIFIGKANRLRLCWYLPPLRLRQGVIHLWFLPPFIPFSLYPFAVTAHTHTIAVAYTPPYPLQHIGLGKLLFERAYLSCLIAYLRAGCVIELLGLISCKHSRLFLYWRASPLTSPPPPTPCVLVLFFFFPTLLLLGVKMRQTHLLLHILIR